MISQATSDALARIADRAYELGRAYDPNFQPLGAAPPRATATVRALDPLSVVAPPETFFAVAGSDGARRLTRDGGFALVDGELRASSGAAVLGFTPGAARPAPLRIDPIDAALDRARLARIEPDGSFSYARTSVDPRSGERRVERVVVGRLALARFPAGTRLQPGSDGGAVAAGVAPVFGRPGDGAFGDITAGARDLGPVDPLRAAQRLQEAYLAFEALQAAGHAHGTLERTALDLVK